MDPRPSVGRDSRHIASRFDDAAERVQWLAILPFDFGVAGYERGESEEEEED